MRPYLKKRLLFPYFLVLLKKYPNRLRAGTCSPVRRKLHKAFRIFLKDIFEQLKVLKPTKFELQIWVTIDHYLFKQQIAEQYLYGCGRFDYLYPATSSRIMKACLTALNLLIVAFSDEF